jgi:hypothetical protein
VIERGHRTSPLVAAAVALAATAAVVAAGLVQAHGRGRPPERRDVERSGAVPPAAGLSTRTGTAGGFPPPTFVGAPPPPAGDLTAELAGLDRSSRAQAAREVGLTAAEVKSVGEIYGRADERRAVLEGRRASRTGWQRAWSIRLTASGLRTFHELAAVLGEERAGALERAGAAAYARLSATVAGAGGPAATSIAEGRLFNQERVLARLDGPFIEDPPAEPDQP